MMNPSDRKTSLSSAQTFSSNDGTKLGYYQQGDGPGLILIHGALSSAENYSALAGSLAADFTVYSIDRRGRGLSGPQGEDYSIQKEIEDIDALRSYLYR